MNLFFFQVIQWPNAARQEEIARKYERDYGLSGIIGFIDGSHIRLAVCPGSDQDYYNRKSFPSMQLQVVVDDRMLIINSYTGWPGSVHDARVLRNSDLFHKAEMGQLFEQGNFLVGDSAYPLKAWLTTPFRNYPNLTAQQRLFNRRITSMRQTVERAIGHLKGRFRRLKQVHLYNVRAISKVIHAGCILHNLCILADDEVDTYIEQDEDNHPNDYLRMDLNENAGTQLRNNLVAQLH